MSSIELDNMINRAVDNRTKELAINMKKAGLSLDQIAEIINCKIDIVRSWFISASV